MSQNSLGKILHGVARILLVFLLVMPFPVLAQGPIDIIVGATHSFPWNESVLKPGLSGTASIELVNNGTLEGTLYIWVNNTSQTDAFGDGAALGKYMYFGVDHPNLVSTLPLPSRVDAFPNAPMTGNYLVISPVRPGETISLTWTWEFVDNGQLQNDAQGDSLRFDINYMLVNGTPPRPTVVPTPYSGYGGGGSSRTFTGLVQTPSPMNVTPTVTPQEEITPVMTTPPEPTMSPGINVPAVSYHPFIMMIGFLVLLTAFIITSQKKNHPDWTHRAEMVWMLGLVISAAGILYQVYTVSNIQGQSLGGLHSIVGVVAALVIILGLLWKHFQEKLPKNLKGTYLWILLFGIILLLFALVLGFKFAGGFY